MSSFSHHYSVYVCLAPCFSNWLHENGNVVISCRFCHATHLPQGVFGAAVGVFDNKVHRCLSTWPCSLSLILILSHIDFTAAVFVVGYILV